MLRLVPLLSLLAFAAALAAQERRPAFGLVVDAAGKPAAAARVRCVGTPWFGEADGPTDHTESETDARGRFVVKLLADRSYSTWADATAAGTFEVSGLAELVAGGELTLQLSARQPRPRIELRGAEAWADAGPLQIEAAPYGHGLLRVPVTDGMLPPLPGSMWLLVRARDGELLWMQGSGQPDPKLNPAYIDSRADLSTIAVALPPPQWLGIRVTGAGKPIAGAEVWYAPGCSPAGLASSASWIRQPMHCEQLRIGTSGADGMVQVRVPAHLGSGRVLTPVHLQVRAAGHAWTRAGIAGPPYAGGEGLQVPADQVLPVALPPGMPLRVEPAQRCALLVLAEQMAGPLRTEQIMHVQADAQGRAVLPLRREPAARDAWLVRALPDGQTTPVWTMPAFGDEGIQVDLRSRLVTVQVRDLRGGPPQGARAVVIPWTNRTLSDVPLLLDGAGRASIRLGAGGWLVLVAAGRTVAWRSLRPDDGDQAWTLDLQPMPLATVRLVDPTGAPAAWRSFPCSTTGSIRERNVPEPEATTILGARMRALWPEASDAEGLLRFPILVSAWTWFLSTAGGARIKLEVGTTIDVPVPAQ